MSRRKPIEPKILEASKQFDARIFSDFLDYRHNKKRILYPVWYLSFSILCSFFLWVQYR